MEKRERLAALGRVRQHSRWPRYRNIGDYHSGAYDCEHVSPYTKSAGNVDSPIFVLLQDWSSDAFLSRPLDGEVVVFGRDSRLPTNRTLDRLLCEHFGLAIGQVYATNLFPFIKAGGMSAYIPVTDLRRAAVEFALPQVDCVAPKLVICLGALTFRAIAKCCGKPHRGNLPDAIGKPFDHRGVRFWCQAHTGALGQNNRNRGGEDRVTRDWQAMSAWFYGRG